jgi:precorrin-2 dehydrogenase/sirohydrochlorin ferrochelatase
MSYFPAYINLEERKILLVGGGAIALEKLEKLLDFSKEITVIAREISPDMNDTVKAHCLTLYQRPYRRGDIEGFDIVIVATDTVELHRDIYEESRSSRVLVNSVDDTRYCDFIFPSYIKRGDLTISFSTSGASPAFARQIRRYFEKAIPEGVDDFLRRMKALRSELPKGMERMKKFESMVEEYMTKNFK